MTITISLGEIIALCIEAFFIAWTVSNIKNIKKITTKYEVLKEKVDTLYREREEDFLKMEQMKRKIEELEKKTKNTPE